MNGFRMDKLIVKTKTSTFQLCTGNAEIQKCAPVVLTWHLLPVVPSKVCQDTQGQVVLAISWKTTTRPTHNY